MAVRIFEWVTGSLERVLATPSGPAAWTPIQRLQRVAPFAVEDDTGIASVRPEHFAGWSLRDARSDVVATIAVRRVADPDDPVCASDDPEGPY